MTTGIVGLDDPVDDILEVRLRVGGRPVTPRHLATHHAGLPFMPESAKFDPAIDERDPYRTFDDQKLLHAADSAFDRVKPGDQAPARYSNFGFALLGLVLARRFEVSYADALRDRVLLPAGLTETSLRPTNPRAVRIDEQGELAAVQEFAAIGPAGGLWMSAAD
nr:serine hydrolase domain-containing protein [Micromonospora sp. DSM 115978]